MVQGMLSGSSFAKKMRGKSEEEEEEKLNRLGSIMKEKIWLIIIYFIFKVWWY